MMVEDGVLNIIDSLPGDAILSFQKKFDTWMKFFDSIDYKSIYEHLEATGARSTFLSAGIFPEFKLYGEGPNRILRKILSYSMLGNGQPITLIGPPGSGKTQIAEAFSSVYLQLVYAKMKEYGIPEYMMEYAKLYEIQMNPSISKSALFQGRDLEPSKDGMRIPMRLNSGGVAILFPGVLYLDELNHAPPDIIAYLNQFLEPQTSVLSFRGQNIRRNPVSVIITAMNPKGKGAGYNLTSKDLPQTYVDRSWGTIFVPRSSYEDECEIVRSMLLNENIQPVEALVRYGVSISRKLLSMEVQTSLRRSYYLAKSLHAIESDDLPYSDAIKTLSNFLKMDAKDVLRKYYTLVNRKEIYHPERIIPFDEKETENKTVSNVTTEKANADPLTQKIIKFIGSRPEEVLQTVEEVLQVFLLEESKREALLAFLP
ncbi:MAG: AAA family ATPase [Nitrososphaerota archaeon]